MDAVIGVVVEKLFSYLEGKGLQFCEIEDQVEELMDELRYIRSFVKDAMNVRRKQHKEIIKTILSDLRELVYDADDIIADCETQLLQHRGQKFPKISSHHSFSSLNQRRQMGEKLKKVNQRIMKVRERMTPYLTATLGFSSKDHASLDQPLRYPVLIDDGEIVGIRNDLEKIKQWVLDGNKPMTVIGIVGMGGIGKTTLAQKIYHDSPGNFIHKVFVTVSQSFRLEELIKNILTKLNVMGEYLSGDVLHLLEILRYKLDGKYLLILDDVWETDEGMWWDSLKSALPRIDGSCLIVTTRNEKVALSLGAVGDQIHQPDLLSNEDSWSLFSKITLQRNGGHCPNADLESLGKEIVAKCRGLPLAIKVVAGMMLGKGNSIHEWRRILKQLGEELVADKKYSQILSALELSYEELPPHLKPCLLCLAMHPEDVRIRMEDMVPWWIGEGFVRESKGKTAYKVGEECFQELLSRCLIMAVGEENYVGKFCYCKMHDVLRDMVISITREENFMGLDDKGRLMVNFHSRRACSVSGEKMECLETGSKLRTLIYLNIKSNEVMLDVAEKLHIFTALRVLRMGKLLKMGMSGLGSGSGLTGDYRLLIGIGSLCHITYIELFNLELEEMPSLENLRNIQVLILRRIFFLKRLPRSITTLENLDILKVEDCMNLECMPQGLGKLTKLQKLLGFNLPNSGCEGGCRVEELKYLTQLRNLEILIHSDEFIEKGELNVLSKLPLLKVLHIRFFVFGNVEIVGKIDHQLSPLPRLEELLLKNYPGEAFPIWISPTSLPNLQSLHIIGRTITHIRQEFWGIDGAAWKIERLDLDVGTISLEDRERIPMAMPYLKKLSIV